MIKANVFQELTSKAKEQQLQKQKRIQADMKLAEDSLNDLYIKVQKNIDLYINPPKYTEIHKILEKEVQDNLVIEQNYYLDITKNGHTRIYYDKNDFDNRQNNIIHNTINNSDANNIENKAYTELTNSYLKNKEEVKENEPITEEYIDLFDLLQKIGQLHTRERSCR